MDDFDLWVDFMTMRNDGTLVAFTSDATHEFTPIAGSHILVGCEDADSAIAKIMKVDHLGRLDLLVLLGTVEDNKHLFS